MGSGPACHLASCNDPRALILMSPFTSIRNIAKQHFGFLSNLVKERFNNLSISDKINVPSLLIHGKSDTLINYE